jgi:exodeoxyribonuclease V beta subunit
VTAPTQFDLLGPLPNGHLAIEASAGTGKTSALAALATRFLAEREVSTSDLLIVTFTRAATSELRARVRERLVDAAVYLEHGGDTDDPLLVQLAATEREIRLGRLQRAVTEFDAATITTIHGFATQVLATLGITSGADPDATMVDDSAQLAAECCAD